MSNQIRPGVRGGRDQFSWDQVKEDKQRLNYLGSSIHGVPDKFKRGNPETFWYAKEEKTISKVTEKSEIEELKAKERFMMETLLGNGGVKSKRTKNIEILSDSGMAVREPIINEQRLEDKIVYVHRNEQRRNEQLRHDFTNDNNIERRKRDYDYDKSSNTNRSNRNKIEEYSERVRVSSRSRRRSRSQSRSRSYKSRSSPQRMYK